LVTTVKQFRRLMGHQHLWMLDAALKESLEQETLAKSQQVG